MFCWHWATDSREKQKERHTIKIDQNVFEAIFKCWFDLQCVWFREFVYIFGAFENDWPVLISFNSHFHFIHKNFRSQQQASECASSECVLVGLGSWSLCRRVELFSELRMRRVITTVWTILGKSLTQKHYSRQCKLQLYCNLQIKLTIAWNDHAQIWTGK